MSPFVVGKTQGINCTGGRRVIDGDQKLEVRTKSKEEEIWNPLSMRYFKGDSQTLGWVFPDTLGVNIISYPAQCSLTEQSKKETAGECVSESMALFWPWVLFWVLLFILLVFLNNLLGCQIFIAAKNNEEVLALTGQDVFWSYSFSGFFQWLQILALMLQILCPGSWSIVYHGTNDLSWLAAWAPWYSISAPC